MGVVIMLRVVWVSVVRGGPVEAVPSRTVISNARLVSSWIVSEEEFFLGVKALDWVDYVVTGRRVGKLEGKGDMGRGWSQSKVTLT